VVLYEAGVSARVRDLLKPDTATVTAVDGLSFSIAPGERVASLDRTATASRRR
jgi:hypothetical protein